MTNGPIPPYGVAIQEAIASGELARMKKVAVDAAKYVTKMRELEAPLKQLKVEIDKLEKVGGIGKHRG